MNRSERIIAAKTDALSLMRSGIDRNTAIEQAMIKHGLTCPVYGIDIDVFDYLTMLIS